MDHQAPTDTTSYAPITTINLDSTFTFEVPSTTSIVTTTTSTTTSRTPTISIFTPTTWATTTTTPAVMTSVNPNVSVTTQGTSQKSKGPLAGIIGTVFVGVIIIIVAGLYMCRQKRRRRLVRKAIAFDPTSVERIYQEEKLREQSEKRNPWYNNLDLTLDGYSRYPSMLIDGHELLSPSPPLTPYSLTSPSMPAPAFLSSDFRGGDDASFDSIDGRYVSNY